MKKTQTLFKMETTMNDTFHIMDNMTRDQLDVVLDRRLSSQLSRKDRESVEEDNARVRRFLDENRVAHTVDFAKRPIKIFPLIS